MLIKNYGLYWRASDIFWGRPHVDGTLEGTLANNKRLGITNFREQAGAYVLYDNLRPVYVGQTGTGDRRLFLRLRDHTHDHLRGRWDTFSWFGIYPVNRTSRRLRANVRLHPAIGDVLHHVEAILIAAMEPRLNLQRGKFGKAQRFEQHRSDDLPQDQRSMLVELLTIARRW